tara:strand:+ start:276 stop:725 length:450 start_codon:yes stop_codon:yes gene_type:complete
MKKKFFLIKIIILLIISSSNLFAEKLEFFEAGKALFEKKNFMKSKFFFEKDIAFNPKSEKSYLYLAKIYFEKENEKEEEVNLNNVILLNPQNDEALYMLTLLKIKQSDYNKAKSLIENFNIVCKSFCKKKIEIEKKFNKLIPENAQDKN